jgi:hypothetical protein
MKESIIPETVEAPYFPIHRIRTFLVENGTGKEIDMLDIIKNGAWR